MNLLENITAGTVALMTLSFLGGGIFALFIAGACQCAKMGDNRPQRRIHIRRP